MAQQVTSICTEENSYVISAQACGIIDYHVNRKDLQRINAASLLRIGQKSEYPHLAARHSIMKLEAGSYQSYMQNEILRSAQVDTELRNGYACLLRKSATPWTISAIHVCSREITFMMRSSENEGKNPLRPMTFPFLALEDGVDFYLDVIIQPLRWPWPKASLHIKHTILENTMLRCTTVTECIGKNDRRITRFVEHSGDTTYVNVATKFISKSH